MYICFTSHMTTRAFAHESARRRRLAAIRSAAEQYGYRGRVSFSQVAGHGGHPVVAVRVFAKGW